MLKKFFLQFCLIAVCALSIPIIDKSLPIVRAKESFRTTFPQKDFQAKLNLPPPFWMLEQIDRDFQDFEERKIDALSLEKTYEYICQNVSEKTPFYHYRILNNKLYKFIPKSSPFSDTDTTFEKAFKTLLVFASLPDVDFILCPMDGLPEPYMPSHFFLLPDPQHQAPILAQAKLKEPLTQYIVLIPDQFSLRGDWGASVEEILELKRQIPWEKKKEMALWRGSLTDGGVPDSQPISNLFSCPRFLLCKLSEKFPTLIDAGLILNPTLQLENVVKCPLNKKEHLFCKYLPVLDGHMCTYPGYQWRLLSNSLCLKQQSDQVQWFYAALKPYVHYVPIQNDMSDLLDQMKWAQSHDEKAKVISQTAQDFALHNLLPADNYLYLYLTLKKLASLEKIDFHHLKQEMKKDPRWKCIQYRKRCSLEKSLQKVFSSP